MANEIRLRVNNVSGTVSDNPLAIGATSITGPGISDIPVVDTTNHILLILDPAEIYGAAEIVKVTAHTAGSITATILRAQEGTTARAHILNTVWVHGPVVTDITGDAHTGTYAPLTYIKAAGNTEPGHLEWTHNGDTAYLMHFTTGISFTGATGTSALLGIGIGDGDGVTKNEGGTGILLSNKKSGFGIRGSNNPTITSTGAHLFHLQQNSMAPLVYLESTTDSVADLLTVVCNTGSPASDQVLTRWQTVSGSGVATFGNDLGRVYASNGRFEWFTEMRANGGKLIAHAQDTTTGGAVIGSLNKNAAWLEGTELRLRTYSGSPGTFYSARFTQGAAAGGNYFSIQAAQSFGAAYGSESWTEVIAFQNDRIGFLGAPPVVRPTSTTDLRTALINLGLYTTGGASPLNLNGGALTTTGDSTLGKVTANGLRLDGSDAGGNVIYHSGTTPMVLLANRSIALITNQVGTAGGYTIAVRPANSGQTANIMEWQDNTTTILSTITENGYFTTRKTAAPADAELAAGELAFWFDSTNGAAKLMVKAKEAGGTVRTGSLALA
jgi:hypothetical protein